MDTVSLASTIVSATQGMGRFEAMMSVVAKQAKIEQQGLLQLVQAAEPLPSPAPGKGMIVDTVA